MSLICRRSLLVLCVCLAACGTVPPAREDVVRLFREKDEVVGIGDAQRGGALWAGNVEEGLYAGIHDADRAAGIVGGINRDGDPTFALMRKNGDRAEFHFSPQSGAPVLVFGKNEGLPTLLLGTDGRGLPLIALTPPSDPGSSPVVRLHYKKDGDAVVPVLDFSADPKTPALTASLTADGLPRLCLMDRQGRTRVAIGVGADGAGFVELRDEEGKAVWTAK